MKVNTSLIAPGNLPWVTDLGLARISRIAVPLYAVTDMQAVRSPRGAWEWQNKGWYQHGTASEWLQEEEVRDGLSPLQFDVIHTLWET